MPVPLREESPDDHRIPLAKGQWYWKVSMSCCHHELGQKCQWHGSPNTLCCNFPRGKHVAIHNKRMCFHHSLLHLSNFYDRLSGHSPRECYANLPISKHRRINDIPFTARNFSSYLCRIYRKQWDILVLKVAGLVHRFRYQVIYIYIYIYIYICIYINFSIISMFICPGTTARDRCFKIKMNPKVCVYRCINFFLNTEVLTYGKKVVAQPLS